MNLYWPTSLEVKKIGSNSSFSFGVNESGPCRDRTDDPQIKSVSDEDESMPG